MQPHSKLPHKLPPRPGLPVLVSGLLLLSLLLGSFLPVVHAKDSEPQAVDALLYTPFGVSMLLVDNDHGFDRLITTQTAYVSIAKHQVVWSDIEKTQGTYDWSSLNPMVTQLNLAVTTGNMMPVVIIRGTPTWAQRTNTSCGPILQAKFGAFADFVYNLLTVSPLAPFVSAGTLKHWEIWNEPDIAWTLAAKDQSWGGCWGDVNDSYYGGGYYAEMLKVVYPRMKSANANAQVILGGLLLDCDPDNPPAGKDCSSARFLEGVLRNNGGAYLDGIAFHAVDYYGGYLGAYSNGNWNANNQTGPVSAIKAAFIKSILAEYNVVGKKIYNTENALVCDTCSNNPAFENTKAYYVAETFATAVWSGLTSNIWYDWTGTWMRNNGILSLNVPPLELPAYAAYKFAASKLGSKTAVRKILDYEGVLGYEFRNMSELSTDKRLWILWSKDEQDHTVYLPATPSRLWDVSGVEYTVIPAAVIITSSPIYLEMPRSVKRANHAIIKKDLSLRNGDFEAGTANWSFLEETTTGLPSSLVSTPPIDPTTGQVDPFIPAGNNSAVVGNPSITFQQCLGGQIPFPKYGAIEQYITVPIATDQTVKVKFDYIIYTEDANPFPYSTLNYDRFEVYINENALPSFYDANTVNSNLACGAWRRIPSASNPRNGLTSGWATGEIDIKAYGGQIIKLSFRNYNRFDGTYNTYTYLDNIRLVVGE